MRIKSLFCLATVALLTSSTLIAVNSAPAAAEPVLATCSASTPAFTPDGSEIWYDYKQQKGSARVTRYPKLGYEPRAVLPVGNSGGAEVSEAKMLIVSPSGALILTTVRGTKKDGIWSYKRTNTTVQSSGFSDVRGLVGSLAYPRSDSRYFYALTQSGLKRYKTNRASTSATFAGWVGQKGWGRVSTLSFSHGSDTNDVLLATVTTGELVQYTISHSDPAKWSRTQIRPRTWNVFTSLNVGWCSNSGTARTLLGIRPDGAAFVYYDKNSFNGAAGDIGRAEQVASNWKLRGYSF